MPPKKFKNIRIYQSQVQRLKRQVHTSRCAVDNITSFQIDTQYKYKIEDLQDELHHFTTLTNAELTRNKLLTQLVGVMTNQSRKEQELRKYSEECEGVKREKIGKGLLLQIQNIVKKSNEETAKINQLKMQVNSNRSERVVRSSMLRKLEKEIKYFEEMYINQLIKSEAQKKRNMKAQILEKKRIAHHRCSNKEQHENPNDEDTKNKSIQAKNTDLHPPLKPTQNISQIPTSKRILRLQSLRDARSAKHSRKTSTKQERLRYIKFLLQNISIFQNLVENITINAQCFDGRELFKRCLQVEQENYQILKDIQEVHLKIQGIQGETEKIQKSMNQMQYKDYMTGNPAQCAQILIFHINSMRSIDIDTKTQKIISIFQQISQLFQKNLQLTSKNFPTMDCMSAMDYKIQQLCSQHSNRNSMQFRNRLNLHPAESIGCCLFEKMERFVNSEKILDKSLLKEQYYKELRSKKQHQ